MRKAFIITEAVVVALLTFFTAVVAEKESDGAISKYIGYEDSAKCKPVEKKYQPIYLGGKK